MDPNFNKLDPLQVDDNSDKKIQTEERSAKDQGQVSNLESFSDANYAYDELAQIQQEIFEDKLGQAKATVKKVSIALMAYALIMQLVAGFLIPFLDFGVTMIVASTLPLLAVSFIIRRPSYAEAISYEKKKMSLNDFLYYLGLMFFASIISSLIINFLSDSLGFEGIDVMESILEAISAPVILYVVIVGPMVEELLYRGKGLLSLEKYSKQAALLVMTLSFALMHGNVAQSLGVLGISLVINYVGLTYSFKSALILHILNNFHSMLAVYFIDNLAALNFIGMIVLALVIYSFTRLIRNKASGFRTFWQQSSEEKKIFNKMIFSWPIFILLLFYVGLIILTEISIMMV